jgi:thiol-disulfide isomerase/thioredoxin
MGSILNQSSYALISIGALLAILLMMRVLRVQWRLTLAAFTGMSAILIVGWLILRSAENPTVRLDEDQLIVNNGKPTFVEFYSLPCPACFTPHPELENLISAIRGDFNIVRVDINSKLGRSLRDQYDLSESPEYVLFDAKGHEVWRDHDAPSLQELSLAMNTPIPGNS